MSEPQTQDERAHRGGDPGTCPLCAILEPLRARLAEILGTPVAETIASLDALETDDVGRLFSMLPPQQRRSVLGSLGVGGGRRRLAPSSSGFVAIRMRQEPDGARAVLASLLTWRIWDELLERAHEIEGDDSQPPGAEALTEAAGELIARYSLGIVRLAIAACWDEGYPHHASQPAALGVLFSDERLTVPVWSGVRAEVIGACADADEALRALVSLGEEGLDEEPWEDEDQWDAQWDEANLPDDAREVMCLLADVRQRTLDALAELGATVEDKARPDLDLLRPLFGLQAILAKGCKVFGLDAETATLAELERSLGERAERAHQELELLRVARLEGPPAAAPAIARAREIAETLIAEPSWDASAKATAAALSALVDLTNCDPGEVERLIALEERARADLPGELAGLCALAGRGLRLGADESAPTPPTDEPAAAASEAPPDEEAAELEAAAPPVVEEPESEHSSQADALELEAEPQPPAERAFEEAVRGAGEDRPTLSAEEEPLTTEAPPQPAAQGTTGGSSAPAAEGPVDERPTAVTPLAEPLLASALLTAPTAGASSSTSVETLESSNAPDGASAWTTHEVSDRLAQLVSERHFGLAYWVARVGRRPDGSCVALKVAALAAAIRSGGGQVAAALDRALGSLGAATLEGDPVGQLLCLQASVRASLLAPYPTEADDLMQALGETFSHELPAVTRLAQAIREASLSGVSISTEDLSRGRDLAELEQAVGQARDAGRAFLARSRSLNFQRATGIWRRWTGEGGLLARLLGPVARGERGELEEVAREMMRLRNHAEVEREIRLIDQELRGSGSEKLEGRARRILIKNVGEAVGVASGWCDALAALEQRRPEASEPFTRLRRITGELRPELGQELEALARTAAPELAAAARAAAAELEATLDLLDGVPLPGSEVSPELALGAELLCIPDIEIDSDLAPRGGVTLTPAHVDVLIAPTDAFMARKARGDLLGAQGLLELLEARGEDTSELRTRFEQARQAARRNVVQRAGTVRTALDRARRQNYLTEDEWRDLTGRLTRAEGKDRLDLDVALRELETVEGELDELREAARQRFHERLADRREASHLVEAAAERIEALLERGDLATAEEYLVLAEAGEEPPSAEEIPDHLKRFFPAVPEALAKTTQTRLLEAAANGSTLGPLSFGTVPEPQRRVTHRALEAWFASFAKKFDLPSMRLALRLGGIEASKVRPLDLPSGPGRAWLDLVGVERTGISLVPAFGSASGDTLRVLACLSAEPATVMGWVSQDPSDRPVLVLQRGVLSPAQRREWTVLCRKAGRAVAVADDAVMAYLAAEGERRFDTLMRITLAFTATNPFQPEVAGNVPVEMFYGRSEERARIIDPSGTSLIYGGRQLGKSALLRAAARRFERTEEQVAVYVDLGAAEIATQRDASLIWALIHEQLCARGLAKPPSRQPNATAVHGAIRSWLDPDSRRRLLLLLDECDTFFDQDATRGFQNTLAIRRLRDETDRRAKVVFAGLHQVQRFAGIPNQPLAHLGKPQPIGPLAPSQAFALLQVPLAALGFEADEDLLARVLAYTNYSPLNLQLYGRALVERLLARPLGDEGPPWPITEADIEAVAESPALQAEIRGRFQLTLSLDPRYRVMAYVMAYRTYEDGPGKPLALRELRHECDDWWPAGFAGLSADEFRALVEEMRGLGVLAVARSGGYIMRSPSVLRMLGTEDEVATELFDAGTKKLPPAGFMGALARRPLGPAGSSPTRRSPLSDQQLAELVVERRSGSYLVIGSTATGIGRVGDAIAQAARAIGQADAVMIARNRNQFEKAIAGGSPGQHHVVVSDLTDVGEEGCRASIALPQQVPPAAGVTRSVVFVGGPPAQALPLLERPPEGLQVVELRRYDQAALEAWAIDEQRAFQDADSRGRLLKLTGGWPSLVERVSERLHGHGEEAEAAMAWLESWLATPHGASTFVAEAGLGDSQLGLAYQTIADAVGDPEDPEEIESLISGLHPSPRAAIAVLRAVGALVVDPTGSLSPEPILRDLWSLRQDAATA